MVSEPIVHVLSMYATRRLAPCQGFVHMNSLTLSRQHSILVYGYSDRTTASHRRRIRPDRADSRCPSRLGTPLWSSESRPIVRRTAHVLRLRHRPADTVAPRNSGWTQHQPRGGTEPAETGRACPRCRIGERLQRSSILVAETVARRNRSGSRVYQRTRSERTGDASP